MKPIVIAFEGIDGSGKGWAVERLAEKLRGEGLKVLSGSSRKIFDMSCRVIETVEGLHRFVAELRRLWGSTIGGYDVVVLDRSQMTLVARWAFQKRILSPESVWQLLEGLFPNLTIWVDTPFEVCRERAFANQRPESHEAKTPEYMESFRRTMEASWDFLAPRLGNRLVRFADNEKAVDWAADMVGRLQTHFDLHLTNACPLKCAGCAFGAGSGFRLATPVQDRVCEVVDAGFGAGISEFHLVGGEPLVLGKRLIEIMRYIREKGGSMHLLTSAYSLKYAEEVLDLISPGGAVFVSLDGPRGVHNLRRGMDIFDNVLQFLRLAQERGIRIRIGTVVDRVNIATAPKVVEVLEAAGIKVGSLCFMNMSPTGGLFSGGKADPMDEYIPAGEWIEFVRKLLADPEMVARPHVKVEPAFWNKPELFGCELAQGKRRVWAMSDGRLYLCPMLTPLPAAANILEGDPVEQLIKLLNWQPSLTDTCGQGCWGGCIGYAQLFGNSTCDGRCSRTSGSQLPEHLRIPEEYAREGFVPICPCRAVRLRDLVD